MDIGKVAFSLIAKSLATLSAALTLLVTAWSFGVEGRGALAATISLVSIISLIFGCSLGRNLAREIHVSEFNGKRYIGGSLPGIIRAFGGITLISWAVLAIGGSCFNSWLGELRWYHLAAGALWVPYYVWAQFSEAVYAGLDEVKYYNSWQIVTSLVALVFATFGGWFLRGHLTTFMVSFGTLLLVCTCLEVWWVYSRFHLPGASGYRIKSSILAAGYLHVDTVGALLFASAGTMIVNKTDGFRGAGAFETAAKLSAMWALIAVAVRTNLLAHSAQVGVQTAWRQGRRFVLLSLAICSFLALIGAKAFGRLIETHFHGFEGWSVYFLIFSSIAILSSLPTILAPLFIAKGYAKYMGTGTFLLGCLNIALMGWLAPEHGVAGALIALWFTYLLAFFINIVAAERIGQQAR